MSKGIGLSIFNFVFKPEMNALWRITPLNLRDLSLSVLEAKCTEAPEPKEQPKLEVNSQEILTQ
jgi:hypothetical protein